MGSPEGLEGVAKARWWAEWQANSLAPRYLMPRWIFNKIFAAQLAKYQDDDYLSRGQVMECAIGDTARYFQVSVYEVKLRALQLGYKQAEGTYLRVKGHDQPAFSFNPDALGNYQTFILDGRNGSRLYEKDPKFAKLIDSGRYVYTGCVVCINNPLYVYKTEEPGYPQGFALTDPDVARKLLQVGEAFRIPGPFFSYEEFKVGNVNHTCKVNYIRDDGTGMARIKSYLVQRVNTYAFQHPVELMRNIDCVTEHIRTKHPETRSLHFHHTADGNNYLMDEDGFWRLSNYVPSVTFDTCDDLSVVRSAGQAFGDFQMLLSDFDAEQLFYTIPDFHNTRKRYEKLKADMASDPCGRVSEVRDELDWLLSMEDEACRLTDLFNAGKLPLRVTHNDTKINNVLFDEKSREALVVIDLDTVMPGLVGHDFGDAIRFAANFVEEDCPQADKAGVNLNIYWAFAEGFIKETAATLTEAEVNTLGISCFALACELATRFLDDYILGDKSFKIKYPAHNLVRTRCQIALAKDMRKKMDAMNAIARDCWMRYR